MAVSHLNFIYMTSHRFNFFSLQIQLYTCINSLFPYRNFHLLYFYFILFHISTSICYYVMIIVIVLYYFFNFSPIEFTSLYLSLVFNVFVKISGLQMPCCWNTLVLNSQIWDSLPSRKKVWTSYTLITIIITLKLIPVFPFDAFPFHVDTLKILFSLYALEYIFVFTFHKYSRFLY